MAINLSRSPRKIHDLLAPSSCTAQEVAPGSYANTHNELKPPLGESVAPFGCLQERALNKHLGTTEVTPGPGTYGGHKEAAEAATAVGAVTLQSKSARIGPVAPGSTSFKAASNSKAPGPGAYGTKSEWEPRIRKALRGPSRSLQPAERTAPSVPPRLLHPGAAPPGGDDEVMVPVMRFTGANGDTVGPGDYEPDGTLAAPRSARQARIHASKENRKLWEPSVAIDSKVTGREAPGPGSYDTGPGIGELPLEAEEVVNTSQFSSKVPMAHQRQVNKARLVPGPGQYEFPGEIERTVTQAKDYSEAQGERSRFGSATERVGWFRPINQPFKDPYNLRHVPGPGHYPDTDSAFPLDSISQDAEKALPGARKKKLYGVHHPNIMVALQETTGPLQAFNTSDDRECLKPASQRTPAPWSYNPTEARGHSMSAVLAEKAKVGRRGAFGSCADRFHGSPLAAKEGLPDPGATLSEEMAARAHSEPRAMFVSQSPRFHSAAGPKEAGAIRVGELDCPGPGDYNVQDEPNYRSPYRQPRQDHLSFGSCKERFDGKEELAGGSQLRMNPGPGDYNSRRPRDRVRGAPNLTARRPAPFVGCTTEAVGPGSYGSVETTMLKKSKNVTESVLIVPGAEPSRRGSIGSGSMF